MKSQTKNTPITGDEIRKTFLDFYESKSHLIIPSSSLIPDDPTVMLTIAGMLPFKPVFLGLRNRPSPRASSSQKCIRTNDIENVGVTARHHTFFEMLGNFSFGDYFKKEAIQWAWELITDAYHLKPENIIISVFHEDHESEKIWRDDIGIDPERIIQLDEKDNFWSSGATGPCGPCSELYYDFNPEKGLKNIDLEDGDRFIEFYNLVFMQYNRDAEGQLTDLKYKNIDTGMGLERMAQILQKKKNNYETDLIFPIIQKASEISKIDYYSSDERTKISLKIIGDHILMLETIGNKSNQVRKTPLTYANYEDHYIVAASFSGSDKTPDWFHNLSTYNPYITVDSIRFEATYELIDSQEKDFFWSLLDEVYPTFQMYRQRTSRDIPLIKFSKA